MSSDEAASFLASIAELKQREKHEDMERIKALEDDIARRRARREERARSISPDKPAREGDTATTFNTLNAAPSWTPSVSSSMDPPVAQNGPPSPTRNIPEFAGFKSVRSSASSTNASPAPAPDHGGQASPSATSLARKGTLSWQQRRPGSRSGSRPASVVGQDASAGADKTRFEQSEPSKEDITASLSRRDPAWFRQTADRGIGSAAYRRSQDERGEGGQASPNPGRRGLPGMQRNPSRDTDFKSFAPAEQESVKSDTTSRSTSIRDSGASSNRFSASTSASATSKPDLKSLIAEDSAQHEASPRSEGSSTADSQGGLSRTMTMSSSQARLAGGIERPSSPTKGMGGFVQSAMMKRSDSVNKRWSTQPGGSPSRNNSVASARSGYNGLQASYSMPKLEPTPGSRESSNEPASRPSSSSSNLTNMTTTQGRDPDEASTKPALSRHGRSKSVYSMYSNTGEDGATSPPGSPSKRFSPTKSSWLESSLIRPESPKPSAPKNAQPSWMANIAKAKAERASADLTPRTDTPKPAADGGSRPGSPTKAPFGQGLLKRSDSRDLPAMPRSSTPPSAKERPKSPVQKSPVQKPSVVRSEGKSRDPEPVAEERMLPEQQIEQSEQDDFTAKEPPQPVQPAQPQPVTSPGSVTQPMASPTVPTASKPKPVTAPKPEMASHSQTDFRSTLRSRPPIEGKKQETPEFLSKFGSLRKAQTEKYVAPDILRANIERGKSELSKTGGPVKTARRDELRESLLAKKDDWKKAKEDGRELPGQAHERKTSGNAPPPPSKPEALAKRDLLARSESNKASASLDTADRATPEALARHKSLKDKPKVERPPMKQVSEPIPSPAPAPAQEPATIEPLARQTSEPSPIQPKQPSDTSRLAARFNPGLANILARGPPAATSSSDTPSRTGSPVVPDRSAPRQAAPPSEPSAGQPLQDMRKGRAKGPKKRRQAEAGDDRPIPVQEVASAPEPEAQPEPAVEASAPPQPQKPRAPPGSAASIMMGSLRGSPKPQEPSKEVEKPATPIKSPGISIKAQEPASKVGTDSVPTFGGFGSLRKTAPAPQADDNKENSDETQPFVKAASSAWGRQPSPTRAEVPPQIELPSQKDEEAAMRSAGLLASSPARNGSSNGSGISVQKTPGQVSSPPASIRMPPKPAKSSRTVSGQLGEASPNRDVAGSAARPTNETERLLAQAFGSLPTASRTCTVDSLAHVAAARTDVAGDVKTVRKAMHEVAPDGSLRAVSPQEEYTFFDQAVYVLVHTGLKQNAKVSHVYVWSGASAEPTTQDHAQAAAKRLARENSAQVQTIEQDHEPPAFLKALGGILVTRRGTREGSAKQYMLCGRKHLGHIAFDQVDFSIQSLCSGFVYLISFPITLQETKLYLWKGSSCSMEETSAARLAAMDLSETGEIIEVDNGAEFASFLKIFGRGTMKSSIPKKSELWRQKTLAPERFDPKLFKVQQPEQKNGLFAMFARRPSWKSASRSPSRSRGGDDVKVEIKHLAPFSQADLEAEGIYILDASSELYILIGPLFAAQPEAIRNAVLGQTLLFAQEYIAAATEERRVASKGFVIFNGVPRDLKMLFRRWDDGKGLWGTAGLMAGSSAFVGSEVKMAGLDEVARAVCRE